MRKFPFPDKTASREELERDILYPRIPQQDRIRICDKAWERGAEAAAEILRRYPGKRIKRILALEGVRLTCLEKDQVTGNLRCFGEYYSGRREVVLYLGAVRQWAQANGLRPEQAQELILAHEFFHHLECTRLGECSRRYRVPLIRLGKRSLLSAGVRALSEIGAHGFARTCFETWEK